MSMSTSLPGVVDEQQQGGLVAGLGYGILRVCEASAPATPDQDAAKFKMVQVNQTRGKIKTRGKYEVSPRHVYAVLPSRTP